MAKKWEFSLLPFRSYGLATWYGYISGVVLGIAGNLFVSVRTGPDTTHTCRFYLAALSLFCSSIGFFLVSWQLEMARNQWVSEGALVDKTLSEKPISQRTARLWFFLILGLAAGVGGIWLLF